MRHLQETQLTKQVDEAMQADEHESISDIPPQDDINPSYLHPNDPMIKISLAPDESEPVNMSKISKSNAVSEEISHTDQKSLLSEIKSEKAQSEIAHKQSPLHKSDSSEPVQEKIQNAIRDSSFIHENKVQ